jgi:hemerythrin-like domain-containing protein
MIQKNDEIKLAGDFLRIHKAITRGLNVCVSNGSDYIKKGFPDPELQQGFVLYLQILTTVLSAHHLGEDEVAFPALKLKLPDKPYEKLGSDHVEIEKKLVQIKNTLPGLASADSQASLSLSVEILKGILSLWAPHIQIEETSFKAAAIVSAMTFDEQLQLSGKIGKYSQEHGGPPFFVLPFVLFNLEKEDRAVMASGMPKELVEVLLPGEWKIKWAPMQPFLLK